MLIVRLWLCAPLLALFCLSQLLAADPPYQSPEPQKTGWPLTDEERAYVLKPEYERRPGRELNKHLPALWPVVPSAGHFGGTAWLDIHTKLVTHVAEHPGPVDVLLVGDSITQQWGSPLDKKPLNAGWQKHLGQYSAINIGIGGDKSQNVLWRLDHGGVAGLEPRIIVLMIGNNNMFFTPETGIEAAAQGIGACLKNLQEKFPKTPVVVAKILPAHEPGNRFYDDIRKTNAALDTLRLERDPLVQVLDLTSEFTVADGSLKADLFLPDRIHLSEAGYDFYASRLKPIFANLLQQKRAAANPQRNREQYLLLNVPSPHQSAEVLAYVRDKFGEASQRSHLKVGVSIIYSPRDQIAESVRQLRADLLLAQKLEVPILVQVDTENWLPESLLNWYDPQKPGFDPAKVADVEWYGWTPDTAVKVCWRNWGTPIRVGPHPNLLSPRFQAWEKTIYEAMAPVVVQWARELPADKQWLYVGWKCGWETMPNNQYRYFRDGNSYYSRTDNPAWNDTDIQRIGYNAAQSAGIQSTGELGHSQLMKVVGRHLAFLASTARSLGLPREKLYAHTLVQGTDSDNIDSQFNADSNPSPSYYGSPRNSLRSNVSFMRCVKNAKADLGVTGYGYGEFRFGETDHATWNRWFREELLADPDCVFQALYNFDTLKGQAPIEQALLDAMASAPVVSQK
jgi:platelet-activating factor acetylhydrolase IB subunit beta/gamma